MANIQSMFLFLSGFIVISLAAKQVGKYFKDYKLPLISGFLFTGIVAGPYVLGLIGKEAVAGLSFIDQISLAFIAFVAGSEIYVEEFRTLFKSIKKVTAFMAVSTSLIVAGAIYLVSAHLPFMAVMSPLERLGISLLAGGILCAISPSSTVAVIKELRAKGPFSQISLGVTVFMDVIVVTLFAFNSSIVDAIFKDVGFNLWFLIVLLLEIASSVLLGFGLGKLMHWVTGLRIPKKVKSIFYLVAGYLVFFLIHHFEEWAASSMQLEIVLEPLLICMVASFYVSNKSANRDEFLSIMEKTSMPIYVIFFTLTGASLNLELLYSVWPFALIIFGARAFGLFSGSFAGGMLAGQGLKRSSRFWMSFVTQAGVGLGLAKEVSVSFPEWGDKFATLIISVIVINQILGPAFFKFAITSLGESHTRKSDSEYEGKRKAIIFGVSGQSATLALQLKSHHWKVKIACPKRESIEEVMNSEIEIHPLPNFELSTIRDLGAEKAGAFVFMLSDDENYELCEHIYEHYGEATMIVLLNDRANYDRFKELGCLIVSPSTAIISLLDHFVRSPSGASLLLGMEDQQDIVDITVRNPNLYGVYLKDMRLPLDVLVVSLHRHGRNIDVHGNIKFQVGDIVTMVGSEESLEDVTIRFGV